MPQPNVSHLDVPALLARVTAERSGYFLDTDIAALAQHPTGRLTQVLIRAGACRVLCAAQDVSHLERCLVAGGDYIRDVSIPVRP
jgi:hypothetical protein